MMSAFTGYSEEKGEKVGIENLSNARQNSSMEKKKTTLFAFWTVRYFALFGMFFCVALFFIGYHNIDIGYNFKTLNFYDKGSDGVVRSPDEIYSLGMNQLAVAFIFFGFLGVLVGLTENLISESTDLKHIRCFSLRR